MIKKFHSLCGSGSSPGRTTEDESQNTEGIFIKTRSSLWHFLCLADRGIQPKCCDRARIVWSSVNESLGKSLWKPFYEWKYLYEKHLYGNICAKTSLWKHLYENIFMKNIFKKTCPHTSNSSASSSFIASIKSSAKASSKASSSSIENAVFLIEKAVFFNRKCSVFQ